MSVEISHSVADGTVLCGTSRGDGSAPIVKGLGWRWSRQLGAWFVPRSRQQVVRRALVESTAAALRAAGFEVAVEVDNAVGDFAELEEARRERLGQRAQRLQERAERSAAASDRHYDAMRGIADTIPVGQPILVGHHSQRRAERDRDRMAAHMDKSCELARLAEEQQRAADVAARNAAGTESPVTTHNRIVRLEKTVRGLESWIARAEERGWDDAARLQLLADRRAELDLARAELEHSRQVRAAQIAQGLGGYTRDQLKPGDLVQIRGHWCPVVRCNAKTVTVHNGLWEDRSPYVEITGHRPAGGDGEAA